MLSVPLFSCLLFYFPFKCLYSYVDLSTLIVIWETLEDFRVLRWPTMASGHPCHLIRPKKRQIHASHVIRRLEAHAEGTQNLIKQNRGTNIYQYYMFRDGHL